MKKNIIGYVEHTANGTNIHVGQPKNAQGTIEPIIYEQSSPIYIEPPLFIEAVEKEWNTLRSTDKTCLDNEYRRIQYAFSQTVSYDSIHFFYAIQRAYGHFDVYLRWESDDIMNATIKSLLKEDFALFEEYMALCVISSEYNM